MANELYIHTLRQLRDGCKAEHMDTETAALDAAIQALSCEGDCISRQAAIKEAESWVGLNGYEQHLQRDVVEWLKELQSAQPEVRTQMSSADCISRQAAINAAIDAINEWGGGWDTEREARDAINALPSVQIDGDCVSRQAVIDAIVAWTVEHRPDIEMPTDLVGRIKTLPSVQSELQWIPCERELPSDNREVEVTCKVRRLDGKAYEYTCHASYVHRYSVESTDYCNWEECDEYNEEEDKYYALPGWYERVHNWDDYSYCAIEDFVIAWRELPEPWRGEEHEADYRKE